MRLPILGLLLGLVAAVTAVSAQGREVLVVIDDEADKSRYGQFWADLEGRS